MTGVPKAFGLLEHFFFGRIQKQFRIFHQIGFRLPSMLANMKFWFLSALILICGLSAVTAQEDFEDGACSVPPVVKQAFRQFHPQAEEVYWENWNHGYRTSFYENGYSRELRFTASGEWVCLCTFLEMTELPRPIQSFLAKRFPDWETPSVVTRVDTPGPTSFYKVCFEIPEGLLELSFDEKGNLIKEQLESTMDEE